MRRVDKSGLRSTGFIRNDRRSDQFGFWCALCLVTETHFPHHQSNTIVFIIRMAERKIDELLDSALLEHTPLLSEFDSVKFESEWSIFRSFVAKKKPPTTPSKRDPPSPPFESNSPSPSAAATPSKSFQQSIRDTFSKGRNGPATTPLKVIFSDSPPTPTPKDITSYLTALHTLLALSGINPALITQFWSQVMYWTSCGSRRWHHVTLVLRIVSPGETFNRILTRKKYLCRYEDVDSSLRRMQTPSADLAPSRSV